MHLSQKQVLEQRLLRVQAVLRLVPHHALRAVDHLGRHLFAAMRRQAVHEESVLLRRAHHVGVDLPVVERAPALLVLGLEAHRGPDVGRHQVGAARGLHRVGEGLAVLVELFLLDLVARRGRDVQPEVEQRRRLQPAVADVVRVADPGHGLAADRAAVLDEGEDVAEDLARVVLVGQAVDHRHARVPCEPVEDVLLEGAHHDDVAHARDHLRHVLHRLAATELRVARGEEDRGAAELVEAGLEREPRARRLLLEDHRQGAVLQRPVALVALELRFQPLGAREQVLVLLAREVVEPQEVPHLHLHAAARLFRNVSRTGTSLFRTSRASASLMTSGGSMRMTVSAVTLSTSPASSDFSTSSPHGRASSTPIIEPMPRTSAMPERFCFLISERIISPTRTARSINPSSLMVSMVVTTPVIASGLPPKVEPWLPGLNIPIARPPTTQAPTGTPEARPLASGTTSGLMPACW